MFASAENSITPTPHPGVSIGVGRRSFRTASYMIQAAAAKMSNASTVPEMFSILPWPYGWRSSASWPETRTATRAMMAATRSIPECIASEITATDPMATPTMILKMMSKLFEATDSTAALVFLLVTDCMCTPQRTQKSPAGTNTSRRA